MKKRRISAVLSAMVMACSAAASVVPASTNAAEADGKFPKIRKITTNLDENKTDVNKDGEVNYYDVREVETYINDLYETRGVKYYETNRYGNVIKDNAGAVKCNKLSINSSEDSKYDLDKDGFLSPEDYCSLLYMITQQYNYSTSVAQDTNSQITAEITGTNLGSDVKKLVIPGEIYDIDTDRIYPVTSISNEAFKGLKKLESVELNNYVQPNWIDEFGKRIATRGKVTASNPLVIKDNAFKGCSALSKVVFPENISVKASSFENTPFFDNEDNNIDYNGVKVLKGTPKDGKNTAVAYSIDFDTAIDEDGNLTFPACVTAISENIANNGPSTLKNITFERDYSNKNLYNLKYIGEGAFCDCEGLVTVNHAFFSYNDEYLKDQMYRYISSFDSTYFMAIETSKQLDKIVTKIENTPGYDKMNDAEKALIAAKYIANSVCYTTWYTNPDEFSLYPNSLYSTVDLARGCYGSEHAGLNVHFTVCEGISKTFALVLDSIGVKNLRMGLPGHATNQVYISETTDKNGNIIPGKWYKIDITNYCAERAREIMTAADRDDDLSKLRGFDDSVDIDNCDSNVVKRMTIRNEYIKTITVPTYAHDVIMSDGQDANGCLSNDDFFRFFRNSEGKYIKGDNAFYFYYNKDNSKFLIYKTSSGLRKEEDVLAAIAKEPVLTSDMYEYFDGSNLIEFDGKHRVNNTMYGLASGEIDFYGIPFNVADDHYIYLEQNGEKKKVTLEYINDKFYAYELNGLSISGEFKINNDIYLFDETSSLVATTAHFGYEWVYEENNGDYFVVIRDENAEREQIDLSKDDEKVLAYLRKTDDAFYLEDYYGNPLSGDYTAYGYTWTFDTDGRFVSTTCR